MSVLAQTELYELASHPTIICFFSLAPYPTLASITWTAVHQGNHKADWCYQDSDVPVTHSYVYLDTAQSQEQKLQICSVFILLPKYIQILGLLQPVSYISLQICSVDPHYSASNGSWLLNKNHSRIFWQSIPVANLQSWLIWSFPVPMQGPLPPSFPLVPC